MMYGWHDGGWGRGAWVAMGFMMLVFWGLIVALVIVLLRSPGHRHVGPPQKEARPGDEAMRILDERFARGEIDAEEYTRRRDLLRER
jgi:putative membrane protein